MKISNHVRQLSILNTFVLLLFTHASYSAITKIDVHSYNINIQGCPTKLRLQLPNNFTRPSLASEVNERNKLLKHLQNNPNRKARYSEIFLTDWSNQDTFPMIMVFSLGSLIKHQGKFNSKEWEEIKSHFLKSTELQRKEIVKKGVSRLMENRGVQFDFETSRITSITNPNKNSFVMLGNTKARISGETINTYNASKMIYSKNCIVSITVSVDATNDDSFISLTNIISAINIK